MNPRRFGLFVMALVISMDETGPAVILQSLAVMAGFEILYLGCRWLALLPRRNAEESQRRRSEAEAAFLASELESTSAVDRAPGSAAVRAELRWSGLDLKDD
jgi:hypothetical protein